jgi:cytochrome c oxidase subunit 1
MAWNLVYHKRHGAIAPANPWKGVTLEWQIASPPPVENFDEIPVIKHNPYWFGKG